MIFSPNKKNCCVDVGALDTKIPVVNCMKFLGVWLDDELNWRKHVNTVILKIKRNTNLLKQGQNFLDIHSKKIIYFAHIQSQVNYCLSCWGNMISEEQISKIQKLLCKCGNLISMYSNLNILSLKDLIKLENYKFGYKLCNNTLPHKIMSCATTDHRGLTLRKTHRYLTWNKLVPNTLHGKCSKYLKSIFCAGQQEFCKLSSVIKSAINITKLVRECKKHLLQ